MFLPPDAILNELFSTNFNPNMVVLIASPTLAGDEALVAPAKGEVRTSRFSANEIVVETSAANWAALTVAQSFYHPWCAFVDGQPVTGPGRDRAMVFQDFALVNGTWKVANPKGKLELVKPQDIKTTALLTVEGERDDICSVGQTAAAHDMCTGLRPHLKRHHLQPGVGHYGTFSGKKWEGQIYPQIRNLVLATN